MTRRRWIALGGSIGLCAVGTMVVVLLTSSQTARSRIPSQVIFQVRGSARTQAQVKQEQDRLAVRAASGPPRVRAFRAMLDGVPLLVTMPIGPQFGPLHIAVTGAPHATVRLIFTLGSLRVVQTHTLNARGFLSAAFMPSRLPRVAQHLQVTVVVSRGRERTATTETVTLLPGLPLKVGRRR